MASRGVIPDAMRAFSALALVVATAALLSGCGPILSVWLVSDAEAKLAAARAAEAEQNAIYEYTAAEAYLKKAHEELGYADYGPAIDYAFKAGTLAGQGADRAREARSKALDEAAAAANTPDEETSSTPATTTAPARKVIIKKVPSTTTPEGQPQ
jgi:hypothetical protein